MNRMLPFPVYDADNHFYEPEDAILRNLPSKWHGELQFVEIKGRKKLAIGGQISQYMPNPTFERVAAPGSHLDYYKGKNPEGKTIREMGGKPISPPDSFRYGKDRMSVLDEQGVHAAMFFPTLFSAIENRMSYNHDLLHDALHSLNLWTSEEWGFARDNRMFGVPIISLADMNRATAELDWILKQGARTVCIRPSPVPGYRGSRSMGLPEFDPFWARINEAKIFVSIHAADTDYNKLIEMWTGGGEWLPFEPSPLVECLRTIDRAISDTLAAIICDGVFDRFKDVRVVSVENGATWVPSLLQTLNYVHSKMPQKFKRHPVEAFHEHIFIAPFAEDNFLELAKHVDTKRILFGSDWPHPEGTATPLDFLDELEGLNMGQVEQIMSSNLKGLLEGKRD
ncbi:amidohydrolase family protein [Sphingomonas crocodyli]|uniref:Amidohydrolase n=1 Tax=Sphingomonas crocodyli TaxID=1979270 RepID=A0A437M6E4_9SPHN|nr:amidohydrolase family protein [Sphingomonas crocodyli]RVT93217.1 amidohydrolase [Sphingomonas crocodyli]